MTEQPGALPQSNALAEASPDSISEFLSRSPLSLTVEDRKRMVGILREQRMRWEAAEAAGKAPKVKKVAAAAKSLITGKAAEELDL